MEYKFALTQLKLLQKGSLKLNLKYLYKTSCNVLISFSTGTDGLLDNLVLEVGGKRDKVLSKYFENCPQKPLKIISRTSPSQNEELPPTSSTKQPQKTLQVLSQTRPITNEVLLLSPKSSSIPALSELSGIDDVKTLVRLLERNLNYKDIVPNESLRYLLVYFAKNGNVCGVKAVQLIVKKYNISYFNLQSGYDHYMAEALWINGKVEESLKLFVAAYDNTQLRNKIKVMLTCLFPLLVTHHGESTVRKTIYAIERLSSENEDHIILGCLWKELFLSIWFSDQQLSKQILQQNPHLLQVIKWMIPTMGKDLLKSHKLEEFYRLIEFTLENELIKFEGLLLRHLFDYYCKYARISKLFKYLILGLEVQIDLVLTIPRLVTDISVPFVLEWMTGCQTRYACFTD